MRGMQLYPQYISLNCGILYTQYSLLLLYCTQIAPCLRERERERLMMSSLASCRVSRLASNPFLPSCHPPSSFFPRFVVVLLYLSTCIYHVSEPDSSSKRDETPWHRSRGPREGFSHVQDHHHRQSPPPITTASSREAHARSGFKVSHFL